MESLRCERASCDIAEDTPSGGRCSTAAGVRDAEDDDSTPPCKCFHYGAKKMTIVST